MKFALILFLTSLAVAQTPRDSNTLTCDQCPSAPEVQQPEPMCKRGFAVMSTGIAYEEIPCSSIPKVQRRVKLWSFRKSPNAPPLYTNKQLLKSKLFWATHAAMWGAMIMACRNPRSGEEFGPESASMAGVTAMDFLAVKYMSPLYDFAGPAYGVQHYIRADLK